MEFEHLLILPENNSLGNNIPLCLLNQGWFIDYPNNNTLN